MAISTSGFSDNYKLSFAAAIQDIFDFVLNHAFDCVAGRFKILAGVEVARVQGQMLTDGGRESQPQVGVNVDFANAQFAGP